MYKKSDDMRVVITGMGTITPNGRDVSSTWKKLLLGESAAAPIGNFFVEGCPTRFNAQIADYDLRDYFDTKTARIIERRSERYAHFALIASAQALRDARLLGNDGLIVPSLRESAQIYIGTGGGTGEETGRFAQDMEAFVREFQRNGSGNDETQRKELFRKLQKEHMFVSLRTLHDSAAFRASMAFGAQGGVNCNVNACATGLVTIGQAYDAILLHHADIIVACAADSSTHITGHWEFALVGATSKRNHDPSGASRPFDKDRDGFVMAEGAGALIVERLSSAKMRGAPIYAEILDWAQTSDAAHDTDPDSVQQARALRLAMERARVTYDEVEHLNVHGTSTPAGDLSQTRAIKLAFGPEYSKRIPITANKSTLGHLMGAAGAVETIMAVMTMQQGIIPPTINYRTPDPDCDLDCVPNFTREQRVRLVLKDSFGFGGQNAAMVLKAYEE